MTFDGFIAEISAAPEFRIAVASDPKWSDQLQGIQAMLTAFDRLADTDTRAIDFCDELLRAIKSGESIKQRLLAIVDIFTRA